MKISLCIWFGILSLISSSGSNAFEPKSGVTFSEVTQADLDESHKAEIEYTVNGASSKEPFAWSLRIKVQGKVALELLHNYPESDGPFKDPGHNDGCSGFDQCKRHWYFNQLPERIQRIIEKSPGSKELAEWEVATMESLASGFLKKKGASKVQIQKVLKEMFELRKSGFVVVVPPISPNQDDASFMYVPSLGYFVPYLDD